MTILRFGHLTARAPGPGDESFLAALYRDSRPDLGALPVPRGVIDGIARHQQQLQQDDYAERYPQARTWIVEEAGTAVARLVLDTNATVRVVDLAVLAGARRRGIARTVLLALQAHAPGEGGIALRVRAGNRAARALYAGLGWRVVHDAGATLELLWTASDQNE